jgi:hypothetical protein
VRVLSSFEEDQVSRMGSNDRAFPFHCVDIRCARIVSEDEFTTGARWLISAEKEASQRIRVHMAFEPHLSSALDIQHDTVSVIVCCHYVFRACFPSKLEKVAAVKTV